MSISDSTENALMLLMFNGTNWANWADNASSSPEANIIYTLNTGDPGDSGTMATSEITYTSYARKSVARSGAGHTVTNNSVSPAANVDFVAGTGGSGTATHFTQGKSGGGASAYLFSGTVSPNIVTGNGVTPRLTTATATTID